MTLDTLLTTLEAVLAALAGGYGQGAPGATGTGP